VEQRGPCVHLHNDCVGRWCLRRLRVVASKDPFKGPLILFIIFSSGVPLAIMVIPVYEIFSKFGFLSILPTAVFLSVTSLPFEVYLMKNFIDAVPTDLEEAARMERASTFQVLRRVVIPLALPGIAAAAIFGFVNAWVLRVPLILISPTNQQPAQSRSTPSSHCQSPVRQHCGLFPSILRPRLHPLRRLRAPLPRRFRPRGV